jgi:hypothetical protein
MAKWWFEADYIETCNCAHGCPCNLTQIPTYGGCNAIVGYHITAGECDGVSLRGLTLGYVASWPGAIHRGNGHSVVFVDETANAAQRAALAEIGCGRAGPGGPFEVFASTMREPPAVMYGPVEFERRGKRGRLKLGSTAHATVGPIRGDMAGDEANVRMLLPDGFIWRDALIVNTDDGRASAPKFSFTLSNTNAFFSQVAYNT